MRAIGALGEQSAKDPLDDREIDAALAGIMREYGFTSLVAVRKGGFWHAVASMNPQDVEVPVDIAAEEARTEERGEAITEAFEESQERFQPKPDPGVTTPPSAVEGTLGEPLKSVTRGAMAHDHHLLPQQASLQARFQALGIPSIHHWTVTVDEGRHLRVLHGMRFGQWHEEWNRTWAAWFAAQAAPPTRGQIFVQLVAMLQRFDIADFEVHYFGQPDRLTDINDIAG
jgi:hypothetical protein